MRQRSINLQRFAGNRLLLMHGHKLHGAHIVQSIGQLNQNHANIARHRKEHLAIVFNLSIFLGNILNFAQLRHAVNKVGHNHAKALLDIIQGIIGIFNNIVEKGCRQGFIVHLQAGQNAHHANRVNNIGLTGFAHLGFVCFKGQFIRLAHKAYLLRS